MYIQTKINASKAALENSTNNQNFSQAMSKLSLMEIKW